MGGWLEFIAGESNGKLDADELVRLAKLTEYGFTVGFMLGGFVAGRIALIQFMAEHQHLLGTARKRSEWVALMRHRNYRVMAAFGVGGFVRGAQMASVCGVYGLARVASAAFRGDNGNPWVDDVLAGTAAGSTFAFAGKGQRLHYLLKGSRYGLLLGGALGALRFSSNKIK